MKQKTLIADLLCEILGSSFIAAAVHNFALAAEFPMTGFSGIAIILHRFLEIPIGISTIILNLPVAFLCYRRIGRSFLLKSFRWVFYRVSIMTSSCSHDPALEDATAQRIKTAVIFEQITIILRIS